MSNKIQIIVDDPDHLEAHIPDFFFGLDEILAGISRRLASIPYREGSFCETLEWDVPVGLTGLKYLEEKESRDFWGYRKGRTILSHLIIAEKRETTSLCCWGAFESSELFRLHTCYPGRPAPREIHNPHVPPEEMKTSVDFWSRHAIIVSEGDFSLKTP
ncbi:MAG: hypothetical protein JXA95_19460 [Spirochaetales bacterium]|nr:hypothetical protein [Spirochaetales bacterium]